MRKRVGKVDTPRHAGGYFNRRNIRSCRAILFTTVKENLEECKQRVELVNRATEEFIVL